MLLLALDMPYREIQFTNQCYYHIFNRGINSQSIFLDDRDYQRALELAQYYKYSSSKTRFSQLIRQPRELKLDNLAKLTKEENYLVEIIAYCLMPSHFHLLLRQEEENGISKFLADFQNSFGNRKIKNQPSSIFVVIVSRIY